MNRLCAQGDILIERVDDFRPSGLIAPQPASGITVVAEGEATGHRHAIYERVTFFRDDELARDVPSQLYIGHVRVTGADAYLRHDEHDAITLAPGTYRMRRQRQVEPNDVQVVLD